MKKINFRKHFDGGFMQAVLVREVSPRTEAPRRYGSEISAFTEMDERVIPDYGISKALAITSGKVDNTILFMLETEIDISHL